MICFETVLFYASNQDAFDLTINGSALLVGHFGQAILADVFAFVLNNVSSIIAEYASRSVLLEYYMFSVNIYLQGILFFDVQCSPKLYRNNDSA